MVAALIKLKRNFFPRGKIKQTSGTTLEVIEAILPLFQCNMLYFLSVVVDKSRG